MSLFKNKLFFSFSFYGILLSILAVVVFYTVILLNTSSQNNDYLTEVLNERENYFSTYVQDIQLQVESIEHSNILKKYVSSDFKSGKENLQDLFLQATHANNNIMQLRFIDAEGMEKVRVEREHIRMHAYAVKEKNLQNKASRYYFKDVFKLKEDQKWYSKIDLNKEHGKIERPLKPVIRVGMPVFNKDVKVGILIVNYFMKDFLEKLSNTSFYNIYVIDKDGSFIAHPQSDKLWNAYLNNKHTVKSTFGDNANIVMGLNFYNSNNLFVKKIDVKNDDNLKMVIRPKKAYVEEEINKLNTSIFISFIIILLIAIALAYAVQYISKEKI